MTHFVPTTSRWLNLVERWFGELTSKRIRRGSFGSMEDLQKAIEEFLAAWNEKPNPFILTVTVESIVEKLSRCRQTLEKIQLPAPGYVSQRSACDVTAILLKTEFNIYPVHARIR